MKPEQWRQIEDLYEAAREANRRMKWQTMFKKLLAAERW